MYGELSSRDVSKFVLENHRGLRNQMLWAMNSNEVDTDVIPSLFNTAFKDNETIKELFTSWFKMKEADGEPTWKDYLQFMNLIVEHQEIEIDKADRLIVAFMTK